MTNVYSLKSFNNVVIKLIIAWGFTYKSLCIRLKFLPAETFRVLNKLQEAIIGESLRN